MAILNSSFGLSGSVDDETPPKMKCDVGDGEAEALGHEGSEISWRRTERKRGRCERRRGPTFCLGPVIVGVDLAEEALAEPVDKEAEDGEPLQWTRISMPAMRPIFIEPKTAPLGGARVFPS